MKRWNKTRKLPAVLLAVLLALSVLAGCSDAASSDSSVNDRSQTASASGSEVQDASDNEEQDGEPAVSESDDGSSEPVDVRIAALKGPTAMGMVKFMNDVCIDFDGIHSIWQKFLDFRQEVWIKL